MSEPTKVLFLDIDGVLNSERSCAAYDGYPHCFKPKDMAQFDHTAIALIRKLCKKTGCSIVLSSTWRITSTIHEVAGALDLPIFDATPVLPGIRGLEISSWLASHPEVVTYAIVDDSGDMLELQKPFFVQTNMEFGLSLPNYRHLLRLLGTAK
jgi:hypothetical protein